MNLQAICHFGIATKFPENKDGTTYKELSEISGLREPDVRRILRGAMTNHVFKEEPLGVVKHTAASNMLAKNPLMRQWIGMYAEDLLPAGLKAVNAMVTWPDSQEPNHAV